MKRQLLIVFCMVFMANAGIAQKVFTNLDSLINYASLKSSTLQTCDIKLTQAKKAKLAAVLGIVDPTINTSYSYIDNLKLPTSLFPSEALGGEPGNFKEVQTGVQYNSNFNNYNELKLINIPGWTNLKLARLNIDLTNVDNKISIKALHENLAVFYYNIVNLQEQLKATKHNLETADTLLQVVQRKCNYGLAKIQDVNESKANYLSTVESYRQIEFALKQQYLSLKILTDIPENDSITIFKAPLLTPEASKLDRSKHTPTSRRSK